MTIAKIPFWQLLLARNKTYSWLQRRYAPAWHIIIKYYSTFENFHFVKLPEKMS